MPYTKLDIVFVPGYSITESSHNVGCIFIDEFYVMNDLNRLEQCALDNIIATNIFQMFFGNFISVSWWDDIWLGDSLSLFLSQLCLSQIANKVIIIDFLIDLVLLINC